MPPTTHVAPTLPAITRNGTSADSLLEGYTNALTALRALRSKLADAAPNARDFCQGGAAGAGDWHAAQTEHRARLSMLDFIEKDLDALAEHACDAAGM